MLRHPIYPQKVPTKTLTGTFSYMVGARLALALVGPRPTYLALADSSNRHYPIGAYTVSVTYSIKEPEPIEKITFP